MHRISRLTRVAGHLTGSPVFDFDYDMDDCIDCGMQESVDEQHTKYENMLFLPVLVRCVMMPYTEVEVIVVDEREILQVKELLGSWTVLQAERGPVEIASVANKVLGIVVPAASARGMAATEAELSQEETEAFENIGSYCR